VSNIGNKIILLPKEVKISIKDNIVSVIGQKGSLNLRIRNVSIRINDTTISVLPLNSNIKYKKFQGLYRTLINNMILGVSKGFKKKLILNGLGYRASIENNKVALSIGFSHIVYKAIPKNLNVNIIDQNKIIEISGIDKELVGLYAAQIRSVRPPEPYLGKGIRYSYESLAKKQGKTNIK